MEKEIAQINRRLRRSKWAIFAIIVFLVVVAFFIISISKELANVQSIASRAEFTFEQPGDVRRSQNFIYTTPGEVVRVPDYNIRPDDRAFPDEPEMSRAILYRGDESDCNRMEGYCKKTGDLKCNEEYEETIGMCQIGTAGQAVAQVPCCRSKSVESSSEVITVAPPFEPPARPQTCTVLYESSDRRFFERGSGTCSMIPVRGVPIPDQCRWGVQRELMPGNCGGSNDPLYQNLCCR